MTTTLAIPATLESKMRRSIVTYQPAGITSGYGYDYGERVTITRDLPNRDRIVATLEIRHPSDRGLSPGFSLTGELYEARKNASGATRQRMGRDIDCGGQMHGAILRAWPMLAPFEALHLSGLDGTPMHAHANGWYWYSSYGGQGTHSTGDDRADHDVAADYLRLDACDLPRGLTRATFAALVDDQRERWRYEARDAVDLFNALRDRAVTSS